jgi:hypothetical protein
MLTFIGTFGQLQGFGSFAPYLLIIQNGSSIVGRIGAGLLADLIGIYNTVLIGSSIIAVMFWVWLACSTIPACVALVVIIGVSSGAFISLQGPMATMTAKDMRYGGTMVGQALCEGSAERTRVQLTIQSYSPLDNSSVVLSLALSWERGRPRHGNIGSNMLLSLGLS